MSKNTTTIEKYELKNGEKRYRFQIYVGIDPLTDKEKRTRRSNFKTQREAKIELARIKLKIDNGTFFKQVAETYLDVYNLWVKHYEKTVEESTFVKTTGIFRNHILPAMSDYKVEKITIDVCQKHVDEWSNKLKKFRTVKSYASKVLDFAIKRGYIQTNPFNHVETSASLKRKQESKEEKKENFYNREELIEFLSCFEKENNVKAYTLFRLLAFSGMRKGEALALKWKDINFTDNEIQINKAISRGKDNQLYEKYKKYETDSNNNPLDGRETTQKLRIWFKKCDNDILFEKIKEKLVDYLSEFKKDVRKSSTDKPPFKINLLKEEIAIDENNFIQDETTESFKKLKLSHF